MIKMGDFEFPVSLHGTPAWGPWGRVVENKTWFGVRGALALTSRLTFRNCTVECLMLGYATRLALELVQEQMDAQFDAGLNGTLYLDEVYYQRCLFLGWENAGPAFWDLKTNKWSQRGLLRFQITRN